MLFSLFLGTIFRGDERFSQEIFCNYLQPHLSYATPAEKLFHTSVTGQSSSIRVPKGDETPKGCRV